MVVRKRARVSNKLTTTEEVVDPTPGGEAFVSWGPSFGQGLGEDLSTFNVVTGFVMGDPSFLASQEVLNQIIMTQMSIDWPNTWFTHANVDGNFNPQYDAFGAQAGFTFMEIDVGAMVASQDVFVPTRQVAGCVDGTNHDGENLQVSSGVATNLDETFIEFDLTGFTPSSLNLTEAKLTMTSVGELLQGNHELNIQGIVSGDEGWDETTLTCPNEPTGTGQVLVYDVPGSASDQTIEFDLLNDDDGDTLKTYIEGRMGATEKCTFRLFDTTTAGHTREYYSKETQTGQPTLKLKFEVIV